MPVHAKHECACERSDVHTSHGLSHLSQSGVSCSVLSFRAEEFCSPAGQSECVCVHARVCGLRWVCEPAAESCCRCEKLTGECGR